MTVHDCPCCTCPDGITTSDVWRWRIVEPDNDEVVVDSGAAGQARCRRCGHRFDWDYAAPADADTVEIACPACDAVDFVVIADAPITTDLAQPEEPATCP